MGSVLLLRKKMKVNLLESEPQALAVLLKNTIGQVLIHLH